MMSREENCAKSYEYASFGRLIFLIECTLLYCFLGILLSVPLII